MSSQVVLLNCATSHPASDLGELLCEERDLICNGRADLLGLAVVESCGYSLISRADLIKPQDESGDASRHVTPR